ncbi:MAG TPA: serine/threonine-protein kinase, partial [Gemmatirosa sp.]
MLRPDIPTPPERWEAVMALLDAALERPAAERLAYVAAAAGDDAALRAEVESLLAVEPAAAGFLDAPVVVPEGATADLTGHLRAALGVACGAPPEDDGAPHIAGRRVGPYRLVRELGRGGMGTVYLAERDDVGRRVALKLVRGGLAAPERVARFLVERRVLARLDHPHVARLLDAGVVDGGPDDGTPWFAMEVVDGEPLDRYCDARRLRVGARLALVEQVCEAVAYAHRYLVVHRDLKPSNVLVTVGEGAAGGAGAGTGAGTVKLLDFGIAKLLADDGAGAAAGDGGAALAGGALTEAGLRLLTPEYAAPEQVRGEPVTTATDVYALGVLLYELLAGALPRP